MRNSITILVLSVLLIACNSNKKTESDTTNSDTENAHIVPNFLADITSLNTVKDGNPIEAFQNLADDSASKTMAISKANIQEVLRVASDYETIVITTGNHTIVKVTNLENCKPSGSWGTCMPHGQGYIKKGNLIYKENYINNIIGLPDSQERKAYFFD